MLLNIGVINSRVVLHLFCKCNAENTSLHFPILRDCLPPKFIFYDYFESCLIKLNAVRHIRLFNGTSLVHKVGLGHIVWTMIIANKYSHKPAYIRQPQLILCSVKHDSIQPVYIQFFIL